MKIVYLHNFRKGLATNSSSTHSVVYQNKEQMLEDLNIFELDFYDRCDNTIAATKEAKIKYILADIIYNEPLVKMLSERYPSMKKYYPLAKEAKNSKYDYGKGLGMYCRGSFDLNSDIVFSYDYICDIIDDDDKIIIGGSDEQDFFYDTIEKHKAVPMPGNINCEDRKNKLPHNGNYYYGFGHSHHTGNEDGKIRFTMKNEKPIPEYPELIDLKITGKCQHNCPMCFERSTVEGKHADIKVLKQIVNYLSNCKEQIVEYSIGGGNVLLYPYLRELLEEIRRCNGKACLTVKADDVDTILDKSRPFYDMFREFVDGIGVSVFSAEDAKKAVLLETEISKDINKEFEFGRYKHLYVVAHMIPEYLGVEKTKEILKGLKYKLNNGTYEYTLEHLYLGYKPMGRGENLSWRKLSDNDLNEICKDRSVRIDTLFGNRYREWLNKNFDTSRTFTQNEGEFSMFIDGVEKKAYMSSYNLDKPYGIFSEELEYRPMNSLKEIFGSIREDNGYERYVERSIYD